MEFILDFQGFKNINNEFIVKELAVVSIDGNLYELQLFQPPCQFQQLPTHLQKQVIWLEKQCHGLYWSSGFRSYKDLKEVLNTLFKQSNSTIYLKGEEKMKFILNMVSNHDGIKVVDVTSMGCPNLKTLKQQTNLNMFKSCNFNHNLNSCAFVNVHVILHWLKNEKAVSERFKTLNKSIKDCFEKDFKNMTEDQFKIIPKEFIINYIENIDDVYDKLPPHMKVDVDILNCLRCTQHYFPPGDTNRNPKRKDCYFCKY